MGLRAQTFTATINVPDLVALTQVHVAPLEEGTLAWVTDVDSLFVLEKASGATPDGTTILAPIAGSPTAGAVGARWLRLLSAAALLPGTLLEAHLVDDASIVATAPTPPFTFPAGQPVALVSLPLVLAADANVEIGADFAVLIASNDNATEGNPSAVLSLWLDGVQVPFAVTTLSFLSPALPSSLDSTEHGGSITRKVALLAGAHTLELRWGVTGSVPNVAALCFAASMFHHATLWAQIVA